jgi:threonine dehydratase
MPAMATGASADVIGPADVRSAARRLDGVAHRTPVATSRTLDERVGARVHLKCENLQRVGAFKFRGAYNRIAALDGDGRARGIIALSSGNHAQAAALAARLCGVRATILMPSDAPATKLAATRGYGAHVELFERDSVDMDELLAAEAEQRGLVPVHPFDDPAVIAGQGTAGLELLEDVPDVDVLVVCTGGGGLLAGCAVAAHGIRPGIRVVGVEPEASPDFRCSLLAGERVHVAVAPTIADGQMLPMPGEHTFAIAQRHVEEVVTISDAELLAAMRFLFERMKLVAEPSGAAAVAALLAGKLDVAGRTVGATISGGNLGADRFAALTAG